MRRRAFYALKGEIVGAVRTGRLREERAFRRALAIESRRQRGEMVAAICSAAREYQDACREARTQRLRASAEPEFGFG